MLDFIPDDILAGVLVRLRFETLVRFRCVSKSWRDLIDSSYIRENHSKRSRLIQTYPHPDSKIIALIGKQNKQLYAFDSVVMKDKDLYKTNAKLLNFPFTKFLEQGLGIVGFCNGILCLIIGAYGRDQKLVLWNPFTNSYFELPPQPYEFTYKVHAISQAFGYDHINDDYKVLIWFRRTDVRLYDERISPRKHELCVYSLKQKSWRAIRGGISFELPKLTYYRDHYFLEEDCTMVNGSAHWFQYRYNDTFIVAFDLASYEFRKISCPTDRGHGSFGTMISCLNGCLSLVSSRYIWVMEEYGVETSWKMLASIKLPDMDVKTDFLMPVAMLQKGRKLLLKAKSEKLVIYDVESKSVCKVAVCGERDWYRDCVCGEEDCTGIFCYATYCVSVGGLVNPASHS